MTFDWQFVVVTAIAFAAALVIARRFVPGRRRPRTPGPAATAACDHCTPTEAPAAGRTQTTPVVSVTDLRSSARRKH
jgi:hypothetical protein